MARARHINFGGQGPQPTQQDVQRLRMAEALMQRGASTDPVETPLEGLGRASQAWAGALMQRRQEEDLKKRQDAYSDDMARILQGATAQPWVNPDTGQETGQAGGLAGALAADVQTPEARQQLLQMQMAQALQPAQKRQFQNVPGVGLVEIPAQGDPTVVLKQGPDLNKLIIPGPDGQPVINQQLLDARKEVRAAGKTTVNNTLTAGNEKLGKPPPGWRMYRDSDGAIKMEPISGGPVEGEEAEKDAKAAAAAEHKENTAKLVLEDLGRAKELVKNSPILTTGFLGNMLKSWGGTPAADLSSLIDTISANISFDRINQMRQSSPTGGALGNVTEKELALLSATAGSLAQSQSPEQLMQNLERLEQQFKEVVHGPSTDAPTITINTLLDKYAPK